MRLLSPPANTTKPVSPPGHQKTKAIKVDPSGFGGVPAGAMLLVCCGLIFMVSAIVAGTLPLNVNWFWANEQTMLAGRFTQPSTMLPL